MPMKFARMTLGQKLKNFWGTPRRFYLNVFRPGYVRASLARRKGECKRCGACCQLVVKCVHVRYVDGLPACRIYGMRPPNCSNYPIDRRDIEDRNLVAPNTPCGFWWDEEDASAGRDRR